MADSQGEPFGRTALIIYGSETGNAQDVAEELGRTCERLRFETQVLEMNSTDIVCEKVLFSSMLRCSCLQLLTADLFQRQLLRHDITIIVISTTGQGDLPANSQTFWRALKSVRLPPTCLKTVRFASFGLGDTSYPKYDLIFPLVSSTYGVQIQLGA